MKDVSVRHHIIPVCYLSRFTNESGLLFVYDKLEKKLRKDKPENICFIKHYNDLQADTCEKKLLSKTAVESFYAESIEAEYNALLESSCNILERSIECGEVPNVNRDLLSKHLWCQYLRLVPFAYLVQDMWEQLFTQLKEKFPTEFDESSLRSTSSPIGDDSVLLQAQLLGFQSSESEYTSLKEHTWLFFHSADGAFITSDFPIVTVQMKNDGTNMVASCFFPPDAAMLLFTLSPSLALTIFHKDLQGGMYRVLDGRILEITPDLIAQHNSIIRDAAKRWVIGSKENINVTDIRDFNPFGDKNIFIDKNNYDISW